MSSVKTKYVGTVEAIQFIRKHHGMFPLPPEELIAMAQQPGKEDELYILVSEQDPTLELVGCRFAEELGLHDRAYDALADKVVAEAAACHIAPPYSVTVANRFGIVSYPQQAKRTKAVA